MTRALSALALLLATGLLAGCAAVKLDAPVTGYLCCNASASDGWIYSSNLRGGATVPFGEPVTITSMKRNRYAYGQVGPHGWGFGNDALPEAQTMDWLKRVVIAQDPRATFDAWPPAVRTAVASAKVFTGMTRAQVLMSIGYPSPEETPDLAATTWTYWLTMDDEPVRLAFDADGVLQSVTASTTGRRVLELQP